MINVPEIFGSLVFDDHSMQERLPKETYKALKKTVLYGEPLDINVANIVANSMKDWALEKGATHYTHWFQPMTGITAEKHDSFINSTASGNVIMEFSGKQLIKGESDASSFPSGGLRATFEARGYTAWDPTSYAFIKDGTLCIPTAFFSFTGEALDKKTPLLRSMDRISDESIRILRLFGDNETTRVITTVGAEQEYFLVDEKLYRKRIDLRFSGRTLFGAKAPKGQELEDHYFGSIKPRVAAYMKELDEELWKLGILSKTKHNEVAPAQHELAPIFTTTNIATDHNQLTMEIMRNTARRHGMSCLLHEKPFAGVNGSGKHNNWAIATNTGRNLLEPTKYPSQNTEFLLFLAAIIKAVDVYQDLLRVSVASAGNDHRLGANEAPPAIISIFLGDDLTDILESMEKGEEHGDKKAGRMDTGTAVLPHFRKDTTDRNRTSPFAFTGNKFEFRMLGSSINISYSNTVINTMVAEILSEFADKLEKEPNFDEAVIELIKETYKNHKRIVFNGNNYSAEWEQEAKARGLSNLKTMPDAMVKYIERKNIDLFVKNKIHTEAEVLSRNEIQLENYSKTLNIEALTMLEMAKRDIMPAVITYVKELTDTANAKKMLSPDLVSDAEIALVKKLSSLLQEFSIKIDELEKEDANAKSKSTAQEMANYFKDKVFPVMEELRAIGDEMEENTSSKYWPMPTYSELLFSI